MNILQLEYFKALAEKQSFSKVAKDAFVSQPSVSMQISALEKEWGIQLFNRGYRSVSLTPAGRMIYQTLLQVTEDFNECLKAAKLVENTATVPICIGVPEYCYIGKLPEILSDFQGKNPHVSLLVESCPEADITLTSATNKFDIVVNQSFMLQDAANKNKVEILHLTDTHLAFVVPKDAPHCDSLDQLKDLGCPVYIPVLDDTTRLIDHCKYVCKTCGFTPETVIPVANVNSALISVRMGLGIALLDEMVMFHADAELRLLPTEVKTDLVLAYRKDNEKAAVPALAEKIWKEIQLPPRSPNV